MTVVLDETILLILRIEFFGYSEKWKVVEIVAWDFSGFALLEFCYGELLWNFTLFKFWYSIHGSEFSAFLSLFSKVYIIDYFLIEYLKLMILNV